MAAQPDKLSADLASLRIVRDAPPPRPSRMGGVAVAAVAVVALVAIAAWAKPYAESKIFKTEVVLTEVSLVSPSQATVDLTGTGYVVPQIVAKVGAKVMGRVAKVHVREGESVKAGAIVFELDPSDQRSAVASAQARTAAARARASAARARAEVARSNVADTKQQLDRTKKLVAGGAANQAQVDDFVAHMKELTDQVTASDVDAQAADADVAASQAEVAALGLTLANMTVLAPIDGTAMTKPAEVGDVVTPGAQLVELDDFASLLVEVDVPEGRMGQVKKGAPCEVVLDAYPTKRMRGEVVDIGPRLNRAKASGTAKVKIVDGSEGVLPEMAARVGFLQKALDAAELKEPPKTIIPGAAVAERGGSKVAFTVDDGKVKMVPIVLGAPFGDGYEVKSGLTAGTRVVKNPAATLSDGQAVKEKGGEG